MGGREHTRRGRQGRPPSRHAVLLLALGVLAGALLLCTRPGEAHHGPAGATAPAATAPTAPAPATAVPYGAPHAVCASPYELPGCSPRVHVPPGVPPVPPPAATPAAGEPVPLGAADAAGSAGSPRPLARAPDLHALQVLRT
ncbi:hypothetical protein ACFWUQ_20285 [Streptomyces sp. NPDC058662]|uniref:hypothetical protein n=1 Tax=Streptomyces sp. NPDC058662 TaxID=3346583 RepID=UPI0036594350